MSEPLPELPLKYGKGRSLVDKSRIRLGGLGSLILGALLIVFGSVAYKILGGLFIALAIAAWVVTRFGTTHFSKLTGGTKAIVVANAIGVIVLAAVMAIWRAGKWVAAYLTRKAEQSAQSGTAEEQKQKQS